MWKEKNRGVLNPTQITTIKWRMLKLRGIYFSRKERKNVYNVYAHVKTINEKGRHEFEKE